MMVLQHNFVRKSNLGLDKIIRPNVRVFSQSHAVIPSFSSFSTFCLNPYFILKIKLLNI